MKLLIHDVDIDPLFADIEEWSKETFQDSTREGRRLKVIEEMDEWKLSPTPDEMADVIITGVGFHGASTLYRAVMEKFIINKNRTWNKTAQGNYKHESK